MKHSAFITIAVTATLALAGCGSSANTQRECDQLYGQAQQFAANMESGVDINLTPEQRAQYTAAFTASQFKLLVDQHGIECSVPGGAS